MPFEIPGSDQTLLGAQGQKCHGFQRVTGSRIVQYIPLLRAEGVPLYKNLSSAALGQAPGILFWVAPRALQSTVRRAAATRQRGLIH